ncbi:MAG: competence/damage-inducible protein A [Acidimicrobiales bacterium]
MRAEVVAVGTELLLGQIVDTNSSWIGEQLAVSGIDCHFQTKVGDNMARIVLALRSALARSDAVLVCGGLGPTEDDITREAIAKVMNVPLERDEKIVAWVRELFSSRGRAMPENNLRQADVPNGASAIPNHNGTAPGLLCPIGAKVLYAMPGVPYEMHEMMTTVVLPDLRRRAGEPSVIASRTLRTSGLSESGLAEIVMPRTLALAEAGPGVPTIAFLASGIEGIKVRLTVKSPTFETAAAALDKEESLLRSLLGRAVFGVDGETMEYAVGQLLLSRGLRLAVAESLTGGLLASRIISVPGASEWFLGGVVTYATSLKQSLLGVGEGPVVSIEAAVAMAEGVRRLIGAEVALATTGVAGPATQDGQQVGTVIAGVSMAGRESKARSFQLPGDRERVRQMAVISALDVLRKQLESEL